MPDPVSPFAVFKFANRWVVWALAVLLALVHAPWDAPGRNRPISDHFLTQICSPTARNAHYRGPATDPARYPCSAQ